MDPLTLMAAAKAAKQATTEMAQGAIGAAIQGIPGPMERKYRKTALAGMTRTAEGRGGLAAGQQQEMMAQTMGRIGSTEREALARAFRGGYAQAAQQMAGDIYKARQGAEAQGLSGVRRTALQAARDDREAANRNMQFALTMALQRKLAAGNTIAGMDKTDAGQGLQIGQGERKKVASQINLIPSK